MEEKEFKKTAKHRWTKRAREFFDKAKNARELRWEVLEQYFADKLPGATFAQRRALALLRLKAAASRLAADLTKDERTKTCAMAIQGEYLASLDALANDSSETTRVQAWTLKAEEADYLTNITDNICLPFVCRDCLFFGMNHQWVKAVANEHFRCPHCGRFYRPFASGTKEDGSGPLLPAQKVLQIRDPTTGTVMSFPCVWQATQEDNFFMQLAEMHARDVSKPENAESFLAREAVKLSDLLRRVAVPVQFLHFVWNSDIEYKFSAPKFPPSTYEELKRTGHWGDILSYKDGDHIFNEWPELIAVLGNIIAGTRAASEYLGSV